MSKIVTYAKISDKAIETEKINIITTFEAIIYNEIINKETNILKISANAIIIYDKFYDEINIYLNDELIIKIKDHEIIFSDETIENPIMFIKNNSNEIYIYDNN